MIMREAEKNDQTLLKETNPVFNTAKTTLFQMARNGNPYAAAIVEKMGLTEDTQKSKSFSMSPEEEITFRIVVETRYQTMGRLARESGSPVLVDLPCGYTPRAIETAEQGREYIGMDLPAVISDMSGIIPSLLDRKKQDLVQFYAVDATNLQSMEKALRDIKGNLCINTEGLLMYFSNAEIHSCLDNIKKLLDSHGGCWITADPEIEPEHKRIRKAIGPDVSEQNAHLILQEKADVSGPQNIMMVRFGQPLSSPSFRFYDLQSNMRRPCRIQPGLHPPDQPITGQRRGSVSRFTMNLPVMCLNCGLRVDWIH